MSLVYIYIFTYKRALQNLTKTDIPIDHTLLLVQVILVFNTIRRDSKRVTRLGRHKLKDEGIRQSGKW